MTRLRSARDIVNSVAVRNVMRLRRCAASASEDGRNRLWSGGGLAEYAVGQVEHGSGGECGPIGFYAEEMLQPEEEGDVEVGGFNGRC